MNKKEIKAFVSGTHNRFDKEIIKEDAFSDTLSWVTKDGAMELARGRAVLGASGAAGTAIVHTGYKTNGDTVLFRKAGTKVQYFDGSLWQDTITGLTDGAPMTFANYSSLAGAFVYVFSTDGIYKIVTASPASHSAMFDSTKNFKGLAIIDKGRSILWGRVTDGTGLYGSKIDPQNSTVYTTVSSEVTASTSGTLAFKAAGATRTCFAIQLTVTAGGQVYSDNYDGTLTGSSGGTGTINYTTGAWTVTAGGAGTVNYQWENSNAGGLTDFSKSAPRQASEGFIFRQDIGGDAIKQVLVIDGIYYSLKEKSIYSLQIALDDLDATNEVFRNNVGILSATSGIATSTGILLMDTANREDPNMRIITRNQLGDNYDLVEKFQQFKFAIYRYDEAVMFSYGNYVLLACKTANADANNIILVCDVINDTVDIVGYEARSFAQDGSTLYTGDSLSQSVYKTLDGFDDLGDVIENFAITKAEGMGDSTVLKKEKRIVLRGMIAKGQNYDVFGIFDSGSSVLLGNVSGGASYVDQDSPTMIGNSMIGSNPIGGDVSSLVYPYLVSLKVKTPKYRVRELKFVANSFGYTSINYLCDWDILSFAQKIPAKYRQKQNVSINDSTVTNLPEPNY